MFLISFWRLIYVIILISYNINNVLVYRFDKWLSIFSTLKYFWWEITRNHIVWLIVILWVIVLIGYAFLYPTWISASIHFLKDKKQKIGKAIWKGINDFFVMFELNALAFSFGFYTYTITVLRLISLDILGNWFAMWLVILWWICVLFASIFWQYAKFILILEKNENNKSIWVFDAIKKSIWLSINNVGITIKWWIRQIIILFIFYFKTFIIISIPWLILYFLINSNINPWLEWIIWTLWIVTTIMAIYIMSIIQAFFKKFRFDIYIHIKSQKEDD